MSRQEILDAVKVRQSELTIISDRLEKSIAKREQGILIRSKVRGITRYYLRQEKESARSYIGQEKKDVLADIAQRQFEEKLLASTKEEMLILKDFLVKITRFDSCHTSKTICDELPEDIRGLVKTNMDYYDDYVHRWKSARYYRAKKTDHHIYDTLAGEKVRSKSEALIADRLYAAGVPYRYEQKLVLESEVPGPESDWTYYPDFTLLNKRTRKEYYWEHLGKMGDPSYCKENLAKLHTYMMHGIIQGKNLILSFESADRPLSTSDVNTLIKEFLL